MSETTIPKLFRVLIIDDKVGKSPEYQEIVSSYLLKLLWDIDKEYSLDVRYAATPEVGIAYWQREVFDLTLVDSDFTKNESSHNNPEDKRSFLDLDIKFTGAYLYRFLCEMQKTYKIVGSSCKIYLWTGLRKERDGINQWKKLRNLVCFNDNQDTKPKDKSWIILKQNENGEKGKEWENCFSNKEIAAELATLKQALEKSIEEREIIQSATEILARVITFYRTKSPEDFYSLCKGSIDGLHECVVDGYIYFDNNKLYYSRKKKDKDIPQIYLSPKLRDNTSLSVLLSQIKQDDKSEQQPLKDERIEELTLRESNGTSKPQCIEVPTGKVSLSPAKQIIAAGTPLTGVSATGREHAIQVMEKKMEALLNRAFCKVVLKTIYLDYLPKSDGELEELHWPLLQIQSQHRARCLRSTGHPRTLWNTGKTALESLTPQMLNAYLKKIKSKEYRNRVIVSFGSKYPQAALQDLQEDLKSMGIENAEHSNYHKYRNSQGTFDECLFTKDVTQVWETLFELVYKGLNEEQAFPWVEINVRHYLRECVNYNIGGNEYLSPDSVDGKMTLGNGYDNLKREFSLWLKIVDKVATTHKKKLILKLPFRGDLLFFIRIILDFKLEKEMCASCKDDRIPEYLTICKAKRVYYKNNYSQNELQYGVQGINLINAFKSAVCESVGGVPYSPAWYGRTDAWFGDASKKTAKYQMSGEMLNASRNELLQAVLKAIEGRGLELHLGGGVVSQEDIRFLKGKPSVDMDKCSGCGRCAKNCNSSAISISSISINDSKPKKKAIIDHFMCRQCGKCVDVCKFHAIKRFQQEVQVGTWGLLDLNLSNQTWTKCDNTAPSIGTGRPAVTSVCKQCTLCQVVCPHGAFNQSSGGGKPEIDGTKCVNCKQCLTQCPNGAVQLSANGVEIPFEEPKTPQNMDKEELNFRFAFWLHELCNGCGKCSRTFYCDSFLDRRGLDWQPLMDIRNCTGCGLCVQTCPQGALQLFAPEHYAVLIGEDSNTLMEWHRRLTAHQIPHFVYTKSELEKVANLTGSEIYQLWKQAVKNDKCSEDNQSPVEECPVILINDEKKATLYSPCSKQNKVLAAGALDELLKHERMQAIMAEVHRRLANLRGE